MKIIFCTILFLISAFAVFAGKSDYVSSNSLVTTYYANAKRLLKTDPFNCMFWADKAISESKIAGSNISLARSLLIKGVALEHLNQNQASLKFLHESLKVAEDFKFVDFEIDALDKISKLYAKTGDYKSAVLYASILHDRKDSNAISTQRILAKTLPGKADLQKSEARMKQLFTDKSAIDNHLRFNLHLIDHQGNWILIIVIGYGLIFLSFIMINRQNKLILLKNKALTDQMHILEMGKMELEHTSYKAEESERLKTAFLANISHEIRTPLNAIIGFSGFLRQKEKPAAERKKYIDVIHQYSVSLLSLIKEIFDVARIESGEIKQYSEIIDVEEFIKKIHTQYCLENIQPINKGPEWVLNLNSNEPACNIKTDPERLKNVILHLVENALKYSENGKIEFGYIIKQSIIEFYIKNDGNSFIKENGEDLFKRFKTDDDFVRFGYGPLGLGLTISKNFIESMGGHIWVKSNNEKVTTCYFTLPLYHDIKQ